MSLRNRLLSGLISTCALVGFAQPGRSVTAAPIPATAPATTPAVMPAATPAQVPEINKDTSMPLAISQAEQWVQRRQEPLYLAQSNTEKQKKRPVRRFVKAMGKELGSMTDSMGKDLVLAFSVQDVDPYDKEGPPADKPAIVLEFALVDGSIAYLRRFPDGSFAMEGGFADGAVILPTTQARNFTIKYPNGAQGRIVTTGSLISIYRPDDTVTTMKRNDAGGYDISNSKLGYMGSASPDPTGLQYELGTW